MLSSVSYSAPLMHTWMVYRWGEGRWVQFLFSRSREYILHASLSTPSFCFPALLLFSSYFSLLLYQREEREVEILSLCCYLPGNFQATIATEISGTSGFLVPSFVFFLLGFLCPLLDPVPQLQKENMRNGIFSLWFVNGVTCNNIPKTSEG